MLTLKLITEETDRVIRGLEKKHFKGAKEAIDEVLAVDKRRREAQQKLPERSQETGCTDWCTDERGKTRRGR